jgi:titin
MVSGLAGTPPGVPTGVSTTIPTPNSTPLDVTVSWSSPTNVGSGTLTGFEVYRDGVLQTTTGLVTSYVDTVPNSGTFVYSLKSVSNHGTSILSSTSSITTATIPVTPVAPTGLIAAPNTTPLDVTVSWVAPGDGGSSITNYDLYRSVSSGSGFAVVQSAITGLTHIDTVPSAGTWYYTIVANNLVGATPQSPELTIATPNVPSAISDLAASTVSDTAINLTWGIPSNGGSNIIDYAVYRDGSSIGTVTTPGFSDIGLTQQTSYTYTVYARNNVGTSLISNSIAQSTHGVPAVVVSFLAAPASLTQIDLTWTAPNDYNSAITSYVIERESPIGGGFAPLITLGSVTSYSDPGLASVQEYNYRIKAVNFYGNGPTVSASTITLPAAPTNVLVTPSSSASELLITWDEPLLTTGIVGYQIVREDGVGTGFSPVTIAFGTNHTDTGLTTNIYYNYKIASAATQGNSAYSDTYSQTTYHLPNGVETLTATSGALIDAALTWSPPTVPYGYITGYEIYQSTTGTPNVLIDSVTATTYTATDLDPTITYYWLVAPVTIHGSNSTSNIVNATATSAIVIGSITLSSEVNTDTVPIFFHEIRNVNSTALTVTYGSTTNLQCDFEYKFARNTVTHGSLAQTYVSNVQASHTFTFNNSANEIISVHCYDQDTNPGGIITNDTTDGKFQINFATQPIVTQVNEFQKGAFGISGGFGAFDLMTMFVVILSMVGFNRKNPAVGVGIMVAFIGAMGYFGIIEVPTIMMGAIAVVVILAIGTARRKLG